MPSKLSRAIPWLLVFSGVLLVAYLVGASLVNDVRTQEVINTVQEKNRILPAHEQEKRILEAQAFNKQPMNAPLVDPWLEEYVPSGKLYQRYMRTLDYGGGVIGAVVIPKINVHLPIYHGTENATLDKGVGHLFGTSLPVGGQSTHAVLTAHSGLATKTMFDKLPELHPGDTFVITVGESKLKYQVDSTEVVEPDHTKPLRVVKGKDLVTLVTCTPYGINTHRLFVHAHRVAWSDGDDALAEPGPTLHWEPWMSAAVAAVAVVLAVFFWLMARHRGERSSELVRARHASGYGAHRAVDNPGQEHPETGQ